MGSEAPPVVVFFHEGFSPYLAFSLQQARFSQPQSRIVLLGDATNRIRGLDYEHRISPAKSERRNEFLGCYRHFHPGNLEDERRCIERWLILADFLEAEPLAEFLFLDSDMLLFQDLREYPSFWRDWDAAGAPLFYSFCHFYRGDLPVRFADWIVNQYGNQETMERWSARFQRYQEGHREDAGIIQDMELARIFVREKSIRILDVSRPTPDGWGVDTGRWGGAFLQGRARVNRLRQKCPGGSVEALDNGKVIRLRAVHVQGFDKSHVGGLTGWSAAAGRAFVRPNYRKNLKYLARYLWNGRRCRSWLACPKGVSGQGQDSPRAQAE